MIVRDLVVKFTSYGHYIASREWGQRALDAASADLHRSRYRPGEARATRGRGQSGAYPRIGAVDDNRRAVQGTGTADAHLVTGYATAQANVTTRGCAATMLIRCHARNALPVRPGSAVVCSLSFDDGWKLSCE